MFATNFREEYFCEHSKFGEDYCCEHFKNMVIKRLVRRLLEIEKSEEKKKPMLRDETPVS